MVLIRRRFIAVIAACLPLFAVAQGYKCSQADGSVAYQDHACAAGTASSSTVPTQAAASGSMFSAAFAGVDPKCRQSVEPASAGCRGTWEASLKACWRTRLPAACAAQLTAPAGAPRDPACLQQATQSTCTSEATAAEQRCVETRLPPGCMQQLTTASDDMQRRMTSCSADMRRWADQVRPCGHRGLTERQVEDCIAAVPPVACH